MNLNNSLSLTTLEHCVPSIFTEEGSTKTSDKYQHISTLNIIEGLIAEGFAPVWATQCRTRDANQRAYKKHMLRFRKRDIQPTLSGLFPELVLVNSHDGLSSYRLMSGVYRLVCSNGLIAGSTYEEIRIRHQGDIMGRVIEGTYEVIKNAEKMLEISQKMQAIALNPVEKSQFAQAAHQFRFKDEPLGDFFKPRELLMPRRIGEFNKNDLFTVFNIVQENLLKGGVRGYGINEQGRYTYRTLRAISSIDQNIFINKSLWSLAEEIVGSR